MKTSKEAAKGAWWRRWAIGDGENDNGCVALPPPDHPVSIFMNTFDEGWGRSTVLKLMRGTYEKHPEVWNDARQRQMAIGVLLSLGANMILDGVDDVVEGRSIAFAVLLLECYDRDSGFDHAFDAAAVKMLEFFPMGYGAGDVTKFYSSRLNQLVCEREIQAPSKDDCTQTGTTGSPTSVAKMEGGIVGIVKKKGSFFSLPSL